MRSPQQHVGVVHSLQPVHRDHAQHHGRRDRGLQPRLGQPGRRTSTDGKLDHDKLKKTVAHRDADARQRASTSTTTRSKRRATPTCATVRSASASWASRTACTSCACRTRREEAVEFADRSMEAVCYYAYWASTELAEERGRYSRYHGSLWDRGILPHGLARSCSPKRAAATSRSTARSRSTGTRCASASRRTACATRTASRSRRPRRSPTSSASSRRSSRRSEPVRQVEPVGRVHRRQRVPGARPEGTRPVGRGDGHRT